MLIGMYADQTGHFTEEELNFDNWCEVDITEDILRKWYEEKNLAEETAHELKKPIEDVTFIDWYNEVSWGGDTDGLYDYSVKHGFVPEVIK